MLLKHHLKALKLPTMTAECEKVAARCAKETVDHLGYPANKVQLVLNRSNAFTGISVAAAETALKRQFESKIVNEYRTAIGRFASMHQLEVWYAHVEIESAVQELAAELKDTKSKAVQLKRAEKSIAKARAGDSMLAFSKLTQVVDGKAQIVIGLR